MTLPTVPPITLAQVCTEFGAPANTPLASFLRGGTYVPNIAGNAGVPTALPITLLDLLGAANSPPVNVSDHTVHGLELIDPGPTYDFGYATINVKNTGVLNGFGDNGGDNVNYSGEWLVSGGVASDYEVRATVVSGAPTGTFGSWLNCGTTRSWTYGYAGVGGSSASLLLEFRPAGGGAVIDSCTITLNVTRF